MSKENNGDIPANGQNRVTEARVSTAPSAPTSEIFKVGVRIPPFWPEEPEIWFAQIEGQFTISGITSDATKFNYVIGQLDNQYSVAIKDIIINPPAQKKYEKLKTELIKRLSASKEKKLKQLLMHEELGDTKPSQFLRHLQSLAGDQVHDDFLSTIWISRLPNNIQTVLAGHPTASLDVLADLADRVHDIAPSRPQVASMAESSVVTDLMKEVAELRRQIQTFNMDGGNRRSRSRTRQSGHQRRRSSSRSLSNYRKFPLCWYHGKYGDKASRCVKPCDYNKPGNSMGGR